MEEYKCVICEKAIGQKSSKHMIECYFVCDDCFTTVGIDDKGMKGMLRLLAYTLDKFVEQYNERTGSNISAEAIKAAKKEEDLERRKQAEAVKAAKKEQAEAVKAAKREEKLEKQLQKMIVKKPGLNLKPGEICFYQGKANAVYMKNVVTGNTRVGARGFSVSNSIRGNVLERYGGTFFITNKRLLLNAPRYGFDIPLEEISTMDMMKDALSIMANGKTYIVETVDMWEIKELFYINNEYLSLKGGEESCVNYIATNIAGQNGRCASTVDNATKNDIKQEKQILDLIREYKSLLDDGIITQEEFDEKKKQLLT